MTEVLLPIRSIHRTHRAWDWMAGSLAIAWAESPACEPVAELNLTSISGTAVHRLRQISEPEPIASIFVATTEVRLRLVLYGWLHPIPIVLNPGIDPAYRSSTLVPDLLSERVPSRSTHYPETD